jgi:hypothetical protein
MYSAVGKARLLSPDKRKIEWELAVKNLRTVCAMAYSRGLKIAIEPLNRFESDLVNTVDDVLRLINDINHIENRIIEDKVAHDKFIIEIRKIDKINYIYSIISYILLSIIIVIVNLKKIENFIN